MLNTLGSAGLLIVQCTANIQYQANLGPPAKRHLNDPIVTAVC